MTQRRTGIIDGNEAAATIAHKTNEVIAIYPITPSSPMGERSDEWSSLGRTNLWGTVPQVIEMQSEAGAAGTVHGSLQAGSLTTTFTSSQGLLLMIPNMYKIAGELTSMTMHVAARSLATQALSIFGDHSDVMATRASGFAMLASNSVQEVMDFALIAQVATLEARVPILHFFDGFRTSHEVAKVELIEDDTLRTMLSDDLVRAHRSRRLSPDHPTIRGTTQNPDVYFQAREAANPYYQRMPTLIGQVMVRFARLTGREYQLFQYTGAEDAERVVILMGSGAEAAEETVEYLVRQGQKVGVIKVRLFRPFSVKHFIEVLPPTVRRIAVLDRTKEPGASGEPLYKDIVTAVSEYMSSGDLRFEHHPGIVGGRYGLSSKEFTPAMVKGVFDELVKDRPRNHFTVGINDDVTYSHLDFDRAFRTDAGEGVKRAVFFGLGSDGTVSANRNTIRIIGEQTDLYVQGYFVYDSKKAGAVTVSHLRFGPRPIRSTYLIGDNEAQFVACHQSVFLERYSVLDKAASGGVFLLNTAIPPDQIWNMLPLKLQRQMIEKRLTFYTIDAYRLARENGMGRRINTIMQTCYFATSGVLPREAAITKIKRAVERTYAGKGRRIVERNSQAIDATLANLHRVKVPDEVTSRFEQRQPVPEEAPEFVRRVTGEMIAGRGDAIPVSLMPADGTYPLGTAAYEKPRLAEKIPVWEVDLCIHCGKCPFVCPHSAIRSKVFDGALVHDAPPGFKHVAVKGKEFAENLRIAYQVAPEDCTGCGLCVEVCPIRDKSESRRKALNLSPLQPLLESERNNFEYFMKLPEYPRQQIRWQTMKGAMLTQPLFEFSSACEGCGETPYIRLATQLFGDRMLIANATGCSSIYGGNLPTTPYTKNTEGRGPAWSNSLFEDNAEFGLGFRLAIDTQCEYACGLVRQLASRVGDALATAILHADQSDEPGIFEQRERIKALRGILARIDEQQARNLENVADALIKKSVWIIGGDGWAYDIGFGGVDHVLASERDVNLLVLDTEVYSNTGGQMSKATPRSAIAKFAAAGKSVAKKDLAKIAMAYGHVYVAQVAFGAKDGHTIRAFREAESYDGPSLIIAYSPCIAHGIALSNNLRQQELAVNSGHWPLLRYDPRRTAVGQNPLQLDSKKPSIRFEDFAKTEMRFNVLTKTHPDRAKELLKRAQEGIDERIHHYQQLAGLDYENEKT